MITRRVVSLLFLAASAALTAPIPLIVDTDAGSDDLLAISFLLSRQDIRIEAITVVNGLAHVPAGAANILRLLELSGHRDIPVYLGSEKPLQRTADFPAEWRRISDKLPGVQLPKAVRGPEKQTAAEFLARRLKVGAKPVTILALGPLTNIALALKRDPAATEQIDQLVIMGGAFRVPGNLGDGGVFKTDNKTAEWNLFSDPQAAAVVFESGAKIGLVPLDATVKVPIDIAFLKEVQSSLKTPLGRFVVQVLESDRAAIEGGYFQAWDPLAALSLVDTTVLQWFRMGIEVRLKAPEEGRIVQVVRRSANVRIAISANPVAFKSTFLKTLQSQH